VAIRQKARGEHDADPMALILMIQIAQNIMLIKTVKAEYGVTVFLY
jgi:hypothetical protein